MIRLAAETDLNVISMIYRDARAFMSKSGNPDQWGVEYPKLDILKKDIKNQNLYVMEKNQEIYAVFVLIVGDDPTYRFIEGGWKNSQTYGTIHRLAKKGESVQVFRECLDFCKQKIGHLRVDTHKKNAKMRSLIEAYGFEYCGIIYVEDGSPRLAYEWGA